jgi:hypothetical protein
MYTKNHTYYTQLWRARSVGQMHFTFVNKVNDTHKLDACRFMYTHAGGHILSNRCRLRRYLCRVLGAVEVKRLQVLNSNILEPLVDLLELLHIVPDDLLVFWVE